MVAEPRRKLKTKKREKNRSDIAEVSKEEYAVAKYVRFNCPTKTAIIMGDEVPYFTASKAVDCLMSSKWAGDGDKKLFGNRHSCVFYMQTLLDKGLFFRAKKLVPKKKETKAPCSPDAEAKNDSAVETAVVKRKDDQKSKDSKKKIEAKKEEVKEKEKDDEETSTKKKSKKVKFDIHQNQIFNDGNDIYVWKYDPTSTKKFLLGLAMVFGSIGVCLFPLWPPEVRLGVYYLSVGAMVFVGVIISLVILRSIIFGAVWLLTLGKHHFWLLPNLTEDCGFFDSFKPFYSHTFKGATGRKSDEDSAKAGRSVNSGKADDDEDDDDDDNSNSGGDQDDKLSDDDDDDLAVDGSDNALTPDGKRSGGAAAGRRNSSYDDVSDSDGDARRSDAADDSLVEPLIDAKTKGRRVKKID